MGPDPSIRPDLAQDELGRFDGFTAVQTREIVEKTRRTKLLPFLSGTPGRRRA